MPLALPDRKLSPNFWLSEFLVSEKGERAGLVNLPNAEQLANLQRLADFLERVRQLLGNRVMSVTSGFRSPEINHLVGGSRTSAHLQGLAADFHCPSYGNVKDVCLTIAGSQLPFDQVIYEGSWCHLGLSATLGDQYARRDVRTAVFRAGRDTEYPKGIL